MTPTTSLLRKFIYSPGIDEPICLIDATDGNAVYHQDGQGHYYHFDGLGSVVALSDVNRVIWGQHIQFKTEMSKMSPEFGLRA